MISLWSKTLFGFTELSVTKKRACSVRPGSHIKKQLMASERERADVRERRREWIERRQPRMRLQPARLVFIDETAVNTKMTRLRGRSRRGQRLRASAPFGRWGTQTFIAALRCDGLSAPWVVNGAMDRAAFNAYVETQLAPTLRPGDVVIADNLSVHKSARAAKALKARGACAPRGDAHVRGALGRPGRHLRPVQPRRMLELLQRSRLCVQLNARRCSQAQASHQRAQMQNGGLGDPLSHRDRGLTQEAERPLGINPADPVPLEQSG